MRVRSVPPFGMPTVAYSGATAARSLLATLRSGRQLVGLLDATRGAADSAPAVRTTWSGIAPYPAFAAITYAISVSRASSPTLRAVPTCMIRVSTCYSIHSVL